MALIKTANWLSDIKGSMGGITFKRDGSGLHIISKPVFVKREPSRNEKRAKDHYSGKKKEEKWGPYKEDSYEVPHEPTTAIIYSLEIMWGYRQPSFFAPELKQVETAGFYPDAIRDWVNINWKPAYLMWGLSKDLMFLMMLKWWHIIKYTYGFSGDVALEGAKVNMLNWISEGAASCAVPVLSLWGGIAAIGLYWHLIEWLDGQSGHISFNKGRVLIRLGDALFWGSLIERVSKMHYDFFICGQLDASSFLWSIYGDTPTHQLHFIRIDQLYQTLASKLLFYYIYNWNTIRCRFRGLAYTVEQNIYELECDKNQQDYWEVPVGWTTPGGIACEWLAQIHDYFQYSGNPKPPL